MKRSILSMLFIGCATLAGAVHLPPPSIGYQGSLAFLENPSSLERFGEPIELRFYLFDTQDSEEVLWARALNVTTDADGNFATTVSDEVGSTLSDGKTYLPLAEVIALHTTPGAPLWITFSAGSNDSLLAPRQAIYPLPRAHLAQTARQGSEGFAVNGTLRAYSAVVTKDVTLTNPIKCTTLTVNAGVTLSEGLTVNAPLILNSGELKTEQTLTLGKNVQGGALFPIGSIIMWSGKAADIPAGWVLCDGTNGTPDFYNRFIVGAGGDLGYAAGARGGNASEMMTAKQMPSHDHDVSYGNTGTEHYPTFWGIGFTRSGENEGECAWNGGATTWRATTDEDAYTQVATENRPPYYTLCFIQRIY